MGTQYPVPRIKGLGMIMVSGKVLVPGNPSWYRVPGTGTGNGFWMVIQRP